MKNNTFAFLDDFCLQMRHSLKRRFFPLEAIDGSGYNDPNLNPAYSTIQYIPETKKYMMWANFNTVFCEIGKTSEHCALVLAESDDGIHYHPGQGVLDGFGPLKNVVYAGLGSSLHGATVLYDPADPDPARRFKCAASLDEPSRIMSYSPSTISVSADGRHWSPEGEKYQWSPFWSDSYNCLIYNPILECYQVFCRASGTDRRISTVTSKDLIHWSEPRLVLHPDTLDGPNKEFYAMPVFFQDGIFYGYLWIFETDPDDAVPYKMAGRNYPELVYSYDGLSWNRTHQQIFALQNYEGDGYGVFDVSLHNTILNHTGDQWLTTGVLTRTGHLDEPYGMKDTNHLPSAFRVGNPDNAHNCIFTIKKGRYCGLESIGLSGRLRTKCFIMDRDGDLPTINVACPYGEMRVQLNDSMNKPVPGFTFEDCIPFRGNELAHIPQWKERTLEETRGKLFNMEIEIYNGCIFGITGGFYPHHSALPQFGYGDVRPAALQVWGTLDKAPDYNGANLV